MVPNTMVRWSMDVLQWHRECCDCGAKEGLHAFRVDPGRPLVLDNGVAICTPCRLVRYKARPKPVDMSAERPRRKTLLARIKELEAALEAEKQMRRGRFPNPWPQE